MSANTPPFEIGEEVVCIKKGSWSDLEYGEAAPYYNQHYTVRECILFHNGWNIRLAEVINPPRDYAEGVMEAMFHSSHFRRIPPYQNSVSKELAEKAMTNPIEVDQPIKVKEVQNAV